MKKHGSTFRNASSFTALWQEALNLTKATPQSCGVLSTIQSGCSFAGFWKPQHMHECDLSSGDPVTKPTGV